jgi:hypothetical protein
MSYTVEQLEEMGYYGDLTENIWQRIKNGANGVLAGTFGNQRAAGKLDVGQTIIGLEKEYKRWLGANGIKNPTRRDFNNFLGAVEQSHGVKFGDSSARARPQPAPVANAAPAASPSSAPAAAAPTPQAQPSAAPAAPAPSDNTAPAPAAGTAPVDTSQVHDIVMNTVKIIQKDAKSGRATEQSVRSKISQLLDYSANAGNSDQVKALLTQIANQNSNTDIGNWIHGSINGQSGLGESVLDFSQILNEADVDLDAPFSMSDARSAFEQIARNDFNNVNGAGNPATRGGGGSSAGGTGSDQEGDAPTSSARAPSGGGTTIVHMDTMRLKRSMTDTGFHNKDKLSEFISKTIDEDIRSVGLQLENEHIFQTREQAYQVLVAYLRELALGNQS